MYVEERECNLFGLERSLMYFDVLRQNDLLETFHNTVLTWLASLVSYVNSYIEYKNTGNEETVLNIWDSGTAIQVPSTKDSISIHSLFIALAELPADLAVPRLLSKQWLGLGVSSYINTISLLEQREYIVAAQRIFAKKTPYHMLIHCKKNISSNIKQW